MILLFSILFILSSCNLQNSTIPNTNQSTGPDPTTAQCSIVTAMDKAIMVIFQDSKNNYWFGSMDQGVYKFDGKKLIRFTTENGLGSNRIRSIQEDKLGNIFFASGEGITKFDGRSFTILPVADSSTNPWRLDPDDLWFEGNWNENGPYRFDGTHLFHLEFSGHELEDVFHAKYPNASFSPYDVYSIYKDRWGNIWFGTSTLGVCRYNGKSFDWISEEELTELHDGPALGIRSIIEDKDGNFWFSKPFHRYQIKDELSNSPISEFHYDILSGIHRNEISFDGFMSCTKDSNGDLWLATYDQGVWKYDGDQLSHYPVKKEDTMVTLYSIYRDHQNDLWLGTHDSGPYKFNGQAFEKFIPL